MKIPNNLAVIPNNPSPGIHYTPIEGGTTAKPWKYWKIGFQI